MSQLRDGRRGFHRSTPCGMPVCASAERKPVSSAGTGLRGPGVRSAIVCWAFFFVVCVAMKEKVDLEPRGAEEFSKKQPIRERASPPRLRYRPCSANI